MTDSSPLPPVNVIPATPGWVFLEWDIDDETKITASPIVLWEIHYRECDEVHADDDVECQGVFTRAEPIIHDGGNALYTASPDGRIATKADWESHTLDHWREVMREPIE